jgi:hypothetical protein
MELTDNHDTKHEHYTHSRSQHRHRPNDLWISSLPGRERETIHGEQLTTDGWISRGGDGELHAGGAVPGLGADEVVRAPWQGDGVVARGVHRWAAARRHDAPPVAALAHPRLRPP